MPSPHEIRFGPYRYDPACRALCRGSARVELPPRAAMLLGRLVESAGEVVTAEELRASVWRGTHVTGSSLTEAMSRLRSALGDDARRPRYVETLPGRGYRFIARPRPRRRRAGAGTLRRTLECAAVAAAVLLAWTSARPPGAPPVVVELTESGGVVEVVGLPPVEFHHLAPSPDGRRIALAVPARGGSEIWLFDRDEASLRRVSDGGDNADVIWSPDGEWLTWASNRAGTYDVIRRSADGGEVETLIAGPGDQYPEAWSPDGGRLVYTRTGPRGDYDLALLRREADGQGWRSEALVATRHDEYLGAVSADGRWLAYVSNRSGAWGVYVQEMDRRGKAIPLPTRRGEDPFWSRDGQTLYFLADGRLMRARPGRRGFGAGAAVEAVPGLRRVVRARAAGLDGIVAVLPGRR